MKSQKLPLLTVALAFIIAPFATSRLAADPVVPKFSPQGFAIDLEKVTSSPHHIWVSSGQSTVNPAFHTVAGVNEFYAPPFSARKFGLNVTTQADTAKLLDNSYIYNRGVRYAGAQWLPHKIVREGTYHRRDKDGKLISLGVVSELVPLFGHAGFVEKITYTNRATTAVQLKVTPSLTPGTPAFVPLGRWGYGQPGGNTPATAISPNRWGNASATIALYINNDSTKLEPGKTLETTFTVLIAKKGDPLPDTVDADALIKTTADAWEKRIATYTKNIPSITSDIPGLDDYYKRSVLSGLVCIWENPAFAINPLLATCGMDGGAVCSYLWDTGGYQPNLISMMLENHVLEIARKMVAIDLERYYAFTPAGTGVGVKYSYSTVAFTNFVSSVFKFIEPDKELFNYAKKLILNDEKRQLPNGLIDYGRQHNLLELQGSGYEHIVVSPNAERAWCLNELAAMGKYVGATQDEISGWKKQADAVIAAVRKELWDEKKQWFASIYPDGFKDYVYTIQVFDALSAGVCTPEMEKALLAQLTDKGYLGTHGMAAVSKADKLHYEAVDTDWGGGGAYVGDGPQAAMVLYQRGQPTFGWDILRRFFWLGASNIYYPQEHDCDRPLATAHTRANEISGLCGAEAILFGLIGFQPQYDGTLYIHPQVTVPGTIHIKGFGYRNDVFDVEVSAQKLRVWRSGKSVYEGVPQRIKIR